MKRIFKKTKNLFLLVLTVITLLSFTACSSCGEKTPDTKDTSSITVNQAVITLKPHETFVIKATWSGEGGLTWSVADPSIATIDDGTVTGVAPGQTVVTITAGESGEYSRNCYITVLSNDEVPTVSVNNTDNGAVQLNVDDEYYLDVEVNFDNKKVDSALKYRSSDETVASVDSNGKILAKKIGEAYVFISGSWREFNEDVINAVVKVIVKAKVSFSLTATQADIYAVASLDGEEFVQQTKVIPKLRIEGTEYTRGFTFESSDPSIATVDNNGVVKGKKIGRTEVVCYYQHDGEQLFAKTGIEVLPIVREKQLSFPITLELSIEPSVGILNSVFKDGKQTVKIIDVTDTETAVKINEENDTIVNDETVVSGERVWEVYNDAYAYRINVLVADYVITTAERFKSVLPSIDRDAYILLGNNISNVGDYSGWNTFAGTFDGMGYTISDINIKSRGIFGLLTAGATIKNLAVSNVTLSGTSGVFGVQADSATIDNVSVWITGASPSETAPCGGLVFQIGGTLNVRNTLVYATGVDKINFGAVTGAWWAGTYNLTNSYFITDGTPCGKTYKTNANTNYNEKGVAENEKGDWEYVYSSMEAFESELVKTDSKINLSGFSKENWNVSTTSMPTFISDISFKMLLSDKVEGDKNGGEVFYFSKNVTVPIDYAAKNVKNGYYNFVLPEEIKGSVTEVFLGANEIENFKFVSTDRTVQIPVTSVEEVICGQNNLLIVTTEGAYRLAVTVADYVIESGDDLQAVLPAVVGKEYILLGANIDWDSTKTYDRETSTNYSGTFDGKGYVIKNFRQNRSLFNTLQPGAVIKNVGLINVSNFGYNRGTLAGDVSKDILIENVLLTVSVSGGSFGLFGRLAVTGAPVTIRNSIVAFEYQDAAIANSYKEGAELVMEQSYILSSKLPFGSDLGEADTHGVYKTAVDATCKDLTELLQKSGNLSSFSTDYWSLDENGNVLYGKMIVFEGRDYLESSDSYVDDYDGWIPENML